MKTLLVPLLVVALFTSAPNAFALAGELKEPGVAHATGYPEAAQQQVRAVLTRPDCKFLGGRFINSHTSLTYAGDTKALNQFLGALAKCPGVALHVSFVADPMPGTACDWHVGHDAHRNQFHIRVNLKSARVKLEELYLPEVKGPALVTAPPMP